MIAYEKYREELVKAIGVHIPRAKIYIYGKDIEGPYLSTADVHLWLDIEEKIDEETMKKVREEIKRSPVPFEVEVADVHTLTDKDREQIIMRGILWEG